MSLRSPELQLLKAVGAKQSKEVQEYLRKQKERERAMEKRARLAKLRRAGRGTKKPEDPEPTTPLLNPQSDEYAAAIPKPADIFSPPSSPTVRASRSFVRHGTPPRRKIPTLKLPSAAELARTHMQAAKGKGGKPAASGGGKRRGAIDLGTSGDEDPTGPPKRPGGGGKKPPQGPQGPAGPAEGGKKKKKKKKKSDDEDDEKQPPKPKRSRSAPKLKRRTKLKPRAKSAGKKKPGKTAAQKKEAAQARKDKAEQVKKDKAAKKAAREQAKRDKAAAALEKRKRKAERRRHYLQRVQTEMAINRSKQVGLRHGMQRRILLGRQKRLQEAKDAAIRVQKAQEGIATRQRGIHEGLMRTRRGRAALNMLQSEAAIARAKLHKQQRAAYRKAKSHGRSSHTTMTMKKAKLQISEQGPGVFSVRSTGMSAQVQKHVKMLLNRIKGVISVNGKQMSKQQAYTVIIDLLTKKQTIQVKISS